MDTADPLIIGTTRPRNPIARTASAVADKVERLEANVMNLPLTSLVTAVLFGAGVVALGVLVGQALTPHPRYPRDTVE